MRSNTHLGPHQTPMMDLFAKIVNDLKQIIIFAKKLHHGCLTGSYPDDNYMFKVNNRNISPKCEICSKLTIMTPEWRY